MMLRKREFRAAVLIGLIGFLGAPAFADGGATMRLFERADTNADGVVTKAEARSAQAGWLARADANGDGVVSRAEARETRRAKRVAQRFERADANGDGALDRAEFMRRAEQAFQRLDADRDGVVTIEELRESRPRRGG